MNEVWRGRGKIESEWLSRNQEKEELAGIWWLTEKTSWQQRHMGEIRLDRSPGARCGMALESDGEIHVWNDEKEKAIESFWVEVMKVFISVVSLKEDRRG